MERKHAADLHYRLRETPTRANAVLKILSHMFALAPGWGFETGGRNPCRFVRGYREHKRERFLTRDEYRRLGDVLDEAEGGRMSVYTVAAIRVLMLTGCRRNEVLELKWDDVDRTAGELRIRQSKTGPRRVPLTPAVAGILDVLPRVPNLASRVLGLSLRRLSADMQAAHGYPALLAETFVDVSRFAGTCYRAANWRSLGLTRGFAREPGGAARWRHHGQPKEVFVFELTDGAPEALSTVEMPANWSTEQHSEPMAAPRLRSLFECLGEVPEYRHARGKRYALNTILTLAVAARLAGYRGVNAFAQFAALLSQEQLKAVGAFWSPSKQRYTPPAITTFHNVLAALPPETLDNAIGQWTGQHDSAHAPVAVDGKDLRGASKQTEDGRRMMVAAVEHDTGVVLGQVEVDSKSNEIPAVRELSGGLDLTGRIVTMDAMHAQHETARCLLGRRADYVVSAVKDNQETILEDLKAIDFSDAA